MPSNAYVDVGLGQLDPRVGIAYRVTEKTVVRMGFGMSTDPSSFFSEMVNTYPSTVSQIIPGVNSYSAAGNLVTGLPSFSGPNLSLGKFPLPTNVGTSFFPTNFRRGYVEGDSFTVQRAIGKDFNAQVAYVGTHAVRAGALENINAAATRYVEARGPLCINCGETRAL